MMKKDSLGDRMKNYEYVTRTRLYRRTPVIIRLDGKAFHTLTRGAEKPFDRHFIERMINATLGLFDFIGGNLKFAYIQSDEISLLLTDWDTFETQPFFGYNIQKLVSTITSKVTLDFNKGWMHNFGTFDARVFNIPREEVANYFIWRQKDWERNSLQMLAQSKFSHREMQNKKHSDIHEMLYQIGINWNDLDDQLKRGICLYKNEYGDVTINRYIPIFTEDRDFIEKYLERES